MATQKIKSFTQSEIKSICDAAQAAWDAAKPSSKKVVFTWNGGQYQSRLSGYQMEVMTPDGKPVAARSH